MWRSEKLLVGGAEVAGGTVAVGVLENVQEAVNTISTMPI